jgi:hypothetical protein
LVPVLILVGLVISNPVWGEEITYGKGVETCSSYLAAYSSVSITSGVKYTASLDAHKFFGFVDGYRSAFLRKRKLENSDSYRCLSSWCRDNPNRYFVRGVEELVKRF